MQQSGTLSSTAINVDVPAGRFAHAHRSARRSSGLISDGSIDQKVFRLGSTLTPTQLLLRRLPGPLVAAASWVACLRYAGVSEDTQGLAMSMVVLLSAERILSCPEAGGGSNGITESQPSLARLLVECCGIFAVVALIAMTFGVSKQMSTIGWICWVLLTPIALLLTNHGMLRLTRWLGSRGTAPSRYIIVGATEVGIELAKRVQHARDAGEFMGFFDFRKPTRLPQVEPAQWGGTCQSVADFVREHTIDAIYVALPISMAPRISDLLQELRDTTASVYFVPNILALDLVQPRCVEIHGIPALAVCETPFRGMSALRKRAMDIVLAGLALLFAAPLMLCIAIAVKLTSPGSVLFKQRRYGLNGEEIHVYKFRSMRVSEDGALVTQATRHDQRITPLGRVLRRTSLDELPQILNVLEGKMSLVGPRPHAVAHNEQYRKLISGYMIRHKVRPGMTGWAQVNGQRGETDSVDKMRARIEYDIDYLKNWSLSLDLKILLRTARLVLHDQQAY